VTRWPLLRGIIIFIAGLAGEVVITIAWLKGPEPNQALMFLFATMMGVPVFLQKDEKAPAPPPPPPLPKDVDDEQRDQTEAAS
jgi:hypothetical protein